MNVNKLLRFLLTRCLFLGVVEVGGGGGAADDDAAADDDTQAAGDDAAGDAGDEGAAADAAGADAGDDAAGTGEADEVVVTLGDEPAPEEDDDKPAPEWIRNLRKSNREKDRALRERDAEIARLKGSPAQPAAATLGPKPTLADCGFDEDKFAVDLEAWHDRKRAADDQQRTRQQAEDQQRAQWQTRFDAVQKAGSALKVPDYEDTVEALDSVLSPVQMGILIGGPDDPKTSALMRYALAKNPKKAQELAAIKDPVKFTFALAKLESALKVTPRRVVPPPERTVRSSVAGSTAVDSQLAKLQAEADKTGDRSRVGAYLRSRNQAKQAA